MNGIYAPASLEGTDELLENLWNEAMKEIKEIKPKEENWKIQTLPLARVKKIMKAEEYVNQELEKDRLKAEGKPEDEAQKHKYMIAADAPILLSRACELLIRELTIRAWQHTERNRRRTLQRQDLHSAVGESEVYDFLIDIVPRVAAAPPRPPGAPMPASPHDAAYAAPQPGLGLDPATLQQHAAGVAEADTTTTLQQPPPHVFMMQQAAAQMQGAAEAAAVAAAQSEHPDDDEEDRPTNWDNV